MSLWQWLAALDGFIEANTPRDGNKLSSDEVDSLFDWIDAAPANDRVLSTTLYEFDGTRLVRDRTLTFKA